MLYFIGTLIQTVRTKADAIFSRTLYKLVATIERLNFCVWPIQLVVGIVFAIFYCLLMTLGCVIVVGICVTALVKLIIVIVSSDFH